MSSFEPLPGWDRRGVFTASGSTEVRFQVDHEANPTESAAHPIATDAPTPEAIGEEQRKQAYAEGLAAGRSEGAGPEYERAFGSLDAAAQGILALRDGYLAANRREVVDLALAVAGAVLAQPFREDADALVARLTAAFDNLPSDGTLTLSLSVVDHDLIETTDTSAVARGLEGRAVELRADPKLSPGEFRLVAGSAEVDGRKETLLADLRERLIEATGEGSS